MRAVVPVLLSLLAFAPAAVAAQPADTSVTYQVNPAHTGEVPGSTLEPPLAVAWTRTDLGQASYPVIAEGKVIVTVPGEQDPAVVALDARTGATLWTVVLPEQPRGWSAHAYEDGRVFVVDQQGLMQALDVDTGARLWSSQVPGPVDSPPSVRDGLVYTAGGSSGGLLVAVRATDGSIAWRAQVQNGDSSSPAVDDANVYVAYACEQVYAFDRVTGEQRWWHRTGCGGGGGNTPVVKGDRVYIRDGDYEESLALRVSDGVTAESFWSKTLPAFAGTTRLTLPDWKLTAGGPWTFAGDGYLSTAPVVANGVAYVGAASGRVYGVNPTTGALVWQGFAGVQIPWLNTSTVAYPPSGLGAGQGLLVTPTTKGVTAFAEEDALPPWEPIEPAPTPSADPAPAPSADPAPAPAAPRASDAAPSPAFAPLASAPPLATLAAVRTRVSRSIAAIAVRSARLFTRSSSKRR